MPHYGSNNLAKIQKQLQKAQFLSLWNLRPFKQFYPKINEFKLCNFPQVEPYAAFLHDAVYLYAHALNKSLNMNESITNGRMIVQNMLNMTFKGKVSTLVTLLQFMNIK